MKYIILVAIIYGIYRFSNVAKMLEAKEKEKLSNKEEEEEGFTDYEEVE